jgi:Protein tyrosine and serine/threonine kinase/FG-GAP repeat
LIVANSHEIICEIPIKPLRKKKEYKEMPLPTSKKSSLANVKKDKSEIILFPSIIKLSGLNSQNGYNIDSEFAGDQNGYSVSAAGDVNGDGYGDLLVGAPAQGVSPPPPGRSYVIYGNIRITHGEIISLSSLNGTNGYKLEGEMGSDCSGYSVSAAGDINGDGYDDVLIGTPFHESGTGRSYVVYGSNQTISGGLLSLSTLNGTNGYKLDGEGIGDYSGHSVSAAGDVNGDGYDDIILGAYCHPYISGVGCGPGRSYVVYGGEKVISNGILSLSGLNGSNGYKLDGETSFDYSGWSVGAAGDINRDGYDDIVVTAPNHASNSGRSYVVYGSNKTVFGGALALSSLNGVNGYKMDGETGGESSGYSVSSAGDVNGDGYADILVGAPYYANNVGRSYIVYGSNKTIPGGVLALSSLNGATGYKMDGEFSLDRSGYSVSATGDVNGDGYDDMLIGAPCYIYSPNTGCGPGRSYVVFGGVEMIPNGILALSSLDGRNGFKLDGEASNDNSGFSVKGVGDINGDGYNDLLIGAYRYNDYTGRSYLVFSNGSFPFPPDSESISMSVIAGVAAVAMATLILLCLGYRRMRKYWETVSMPDSSATMQPLLKDSKEPMTSLTPPRLMDGVGEMKISFNVPYKDLEFDEKDKLGFGAYGIVYKGTYKFNEVAIKKLHTEHLSTDAVAELKQEASILDTMRSDYIVQLRGVCLETPHYCLVMELMPKGSLSSLLQNSPELPLLTRYRIGLDVCYGLYHLHERNILHQDLKSLNVLLDDRLRAKITDFGLSRIKSELAATSSSKGMKGTLGWIAPELFEEKPKATTAADIYAFGMVLWEMIVKPYRIPFQGLAPAPLLAAKLKRGDIQETIPDTCASELSQLMRACWQQEPVKRPSAEELAKSLGTLFGNQKRQTVSQKLADSVILAKYNQFAGIP